MALDINDGGRMKQWLHEVGEEEFLHAVLGSNLANIKDLLPVFGICVPSPILQALSEDECLPIVKLAIKKELSRRRRLPQYSTIDRAVSLLQESRRIMVLTGAGISTSVGIPDFRSQETGLYARLEHLGLADPQEVFDIHLFREDPSIFYSIAADILPSKPRFSPTHAFIHLLQERGQLLTNYTQNIDNLEAAAGVRRENLIQCHGSFATASCIECGHKVQGTEILDEVLAHKVPACRAPTIMLPLPNSSIVRNKKQRPGGRRKRPEWENSSDEDETLEQEPTAVSCQGVLKPDITFFGESLPPEFHRRLLEHDQDKVDLVLVVGTSLKVAPVSEVIGILPRDVPQIFISREPCNHVEFDIELLGECDLVVAELCRRTGWQLEHDMISSHPVDIIQRDPALPRFYFSPQQVSS